MKERYSIRDRQESKVTSGAESDIPTDTWRYAIVNHNSPFVCGEIIALVLDKAFAELIAGLLNDNQHDWEKLMKKIKRNSHEIAE